MMKITNCVMGLSVVEDAPKDKITHLLMVLSQAIFQIVMHLYLRFGG